MNRSRARRLRTTLVVVFCMLFAQFALAQYVCPALAGESGPVAMEMAPGQPCSGMDDSHGGTDQPALCHQHCEHAAQSFEPVKVPTVSAPAVVQVLAVPLYAAASFPPRVPAAADTQAKPPPDPVFLSTLRLRV